MKPKNAGCRFRLTIDEEKATFKGLIGFDEDGKADDKYFGVQRRYGT